MTITKTLIACHDCDLLQHLPAPGAAGRMLCARCGALLSERYDVRHDTTLALTLTCAILFLIANAYPIVSLESQDMRVSSTLIEAVQLLWSSKMELIALLVLATTVLVPGGEILLLLRVLLRARPDATSLRLLEYLRPWAMIDVFVIGVLVSIKKLADMAGIIPGPALWAFCALMLLSTLVKSGASVHALWRRVPRPGTVDGH